jgi:hypothetical protein
MRGARRRSVDKCPVCGAPLAVHPPHAAKRGIVDVRSRLLWRAALRLACMSRRHRSSSRWTLRSCHSGITVCILVVGAINGRAWRRSKSRWSMLSFDAANVLINVYEFESERCALS